MEVSLLIIIITSVGLWIGYLQYRLAKQRARFDFYTKGNPVFSATMTYLANIARDRNITGEELNKFLRNTKDKAFLFGEDVQQLLNELYKKGAEYQLIRHKVEIRVVPQEKHEELVNKEVELFEWFLKQFATSEEVFKKYLSIN